MRHQPNHEVPRNGPQDEAFPRLPHPRWSQELLHWFDDRSFAELIERFIEACPGPYLAIKGLRLMAHQRVEGIAALELDGKEAQGSREERGVRGRQGYLWSVREIARQLRGVRPGYLSESALRKGYQYSRALRWIRFLHGKALVDRGIRGDVMARRLGFSDPAGWTRFVNALVGSTPTQLTPLPLAAWVERAIEDVYGSSESDLPGEHS